ncbi:MAG: hypothetical protein MUO21_10520, partial [Nitrososphaeraceae archaeon]|nr:hypothetical protein [Nitrososphaeraceae archaeon]
YKMEASKSTSTSLTPMVIKCIIDESMNTRSSELVLSGVDLYDQPDLSKLTWVEKLDLSRNNLKKVSKELFPPNIKLLCLDQNKIVNFTHQDIPESVNNLMMCCNQIVHFDGTNFSNIKKINLSVNCLESFIFPPNANKVDISTNALEKVGDFPENLVKLICNDNMIVSFPSINNKLVYIDISSNKFSEMPPFPDTMKHIVAKENYISDIWFIPENIIEFNVENNRLRNLNSYTVQFPLSLRLLNLSDNMLNDIPELPVGVVEVYISGNRIDELPKIPQSVKVLDISDNCLPKIPEELKKRCIKLKYDNNLIHDDSDDLYHSSSQEDNLFGSMFDIPPKKTQDVLDYFKKDTKSSSPNVTYYSGNNAHNVYGYQFGTSTYSYSQSPPKPKYIYISHKKKVVV